MTENNSSNKKWCDLDIQDKIKMIIAISLVAASIILGFVSFVILLEIPGSVLGLEGLWLSAALAIFGIASYFHNELVQFKSEVKCRLNNIGNTTLSIEDKNIDDEQ